MASPLHTLTSDDPAVAKAHAARDAAADALTTAEASLADLVARHASTEAEADRLAVESVKGRADQADARAKTQEADALAAEVEEATDAVREARAAAAAAEAKATEVWDRVWERIADEKRSAHRDLVARFAGHIEALHRIADEAQDVERDLRACDLLPTYRPLYYDVVHLRRRGAAHQVDDARSVLTGWKNAGITPASL